MECDSVLGQQSISGKNVSLILCVWKPCYVKSGHKCLDYVVYSIHRPIPKMNFESAYLSDGLADSTEI